MLDVAVRGRLGQARVERGRGSMGIGKFVLLLAESRVWLMPLRGGTDAGDVLIDRFIPNREGQDLQATYSLLHEDGCPSTPSKTKKRTPHSELHFQKS